MSVSRGPRPADEPTSLTVHSRVRDYEVEFDDGDAWARQLANLERTFVVIDENVMRLHGDGVLAELRGESIAVLPISEERKVFETVAELSEIVTHRPAKRNTTLLSIGGGITQDVTGFMASVLYRGIGWVYVPTTLLAMADSCIGGKTSLNLGSRKNLLGTIYPPSRVIIHTPFVTTLADSDFASGVGEIVKLHMLGGEGTAVGIREDLAALMAREPAAVNRATHVSLEIKRGFIEEDEFDRGRRNLLNYGHCFGHALETATDFAFPHGIAVVIGMRLADLVARSRGLLGEEEAAGRETTFYRPVVPKWPRLDSATRTALVDGMAYDKKRTGTGLAVVVLGDRLRATQLSDVSPDEARDALAEMVAQSPA